MDTVPKTRPLVFPFASSIFMDIPAPPPTCGRYSPSLSRVFSSSARTEAASSRNSGRFLKAS